MSYYNIRIAKSIIIIIIFKQFHTGKITSNFYIPLGLLGSYFPGMLTDRNEVPLVPFK